MPFSLARKIVALISVSYIVCCINLADAIPKANQVIIPTAPSLQASSYILMDHNSGQILVEHNIHERVAPASLTKMMAMYVVDQELANGRISLNDKVTISKNAWQTEGTRMFLEVGSTVTVDELRKGLVIQSGNDATVALAEHIAGSEEAFVELMNYYTEILGMKNTNFGLATGLPNENTYTTAYDLAILSRAVINDFPETYKIYSQKSYMHNGINQNNRNRLLWKDKSVDGIKTGVTDAAGYCLAASAKRGDMRLIAVTMGNSSDDARTSQTQKLLSFGFRFYETHKLYDADTKVVENKVWMGSDSSISLGLTNDLYVTVPIGQYENLKAKVTVDKKLTAPIAKNSKQGNLQLSLGNEVIANTSLYALNDIEQGGAFSRFVDYVKLQFTSNDK